MRTTHVRSVKRSAERNLLHLLGAWLRQDMPLGTVPSEVQDWHYEIGKCRTRMDASVTTTMAPFRKASSRTGMFFRSTRA